MKTFGEFVTENKTHATFKHNKTGETVALVPNGNKFLNIHTNTHISASSVLKNYTRVDDHKNNPLKM